MKTILVVEDNALNMKLVRGLLGLRDYRLLEASDAELALQLAERETPDLILMDIQLPGMDGLTATRRLKAIDRLQHVPVVALTSYAMAGDEAKAAEAGCDGYITKPIDTRSFLGKVEKHLSPSGDPNAAAEKPAAASPAASRLRNQPLVLVVDDEPKNVKLLTAKLADQSYTIKAAFNGAEALEMVHRHSPDLILLDVMMPGMDGYEVTQQLKQNEATKAIPIIMITALDGPEDKERGMAVGAQEFLTKPVNTAELQARVGSMLRLKQFKEQLESRRESKAQFGRGSTAVSEQSRSRRSHILLVEDDQKDVKLLESVLQESPCELRVTASAEDALKIIEDGWRVDLLLLDVILPGMSGFDLCRRLKRDPHQQDIQVVLITCLDDLESRIRGVELGADDFLVKPVDSRELRARVRVLLEKKHSIDKLRSDYAEALNSAINDGLTGLYNRTYFTRFLEQEILRSNRQGYAVGLLMVDLDDFKRVNDTMGHLEGDRVLQETARLLRDGVREIDLTARYGGEEFAIVFPYADPDGLRRAAHRLLGAVGAHRFFREPINGLNKVTASMGLALYPQNAASVAELIEAADAMLYEAKQQGKNRLRVFGEGLAN
ncbi:MAG: response regulator [Desulfosarcinaceae bacterium]|nr:response regulator [Desulfosarcinaceae bacterium]